MNKPQLVVRKQGEVYVAEFDQAFFKDEIEPLYSGPDFQRYLTQCKPVEGGLELIASAAMPFRSYQVTEGEYLTAKSDVVSRRKNIAGVHSGILAEAEKIAEQQGVPYFGLVVVARQGDFPGKPVDADIEVSEILSAASEPEDFDPYAVKNYSKEFKDLLEEKIPVKATWILHPTVNLYVPKGE